VETDLREPIHEHGVLGLDKGEGEGGGGGCRRCAGAGGGCLGCPWDVSVGHRAVRQPAETHFRDRSPSRGMSPYRRGCHRTGDVTLQARGVIVQGVSGPTGVGGATVKGALCACGQQAEGR